MKYPLEEILPRDFVGNPEVVGIEAVRRVQDNLNSKAVMVSWQTVAMMTVGVSVMMIMHLFVVFLVAFFLV